MFIISYLRKKRTITENQQTLENLDDDFIVITDKLEDKTEETNGAFGSAIGLRPYENVNEQNDTENLDTFVSINNTSFSASFRDEETSDKSVADEENQLIENTKDVDCKKISFCNKIIKYVTIFIFGEDVKKN
jgi:hypothetical protein